MSVFKKGDWVRVVDNRGAPFDYSVGDIVQVTSVGRDLLFAGNSAMNIERFEPWQPRVGERVRVTASANSVWTGEADVVAFHVAYGTYELKMLTGRFAGRSGDFRISELEPVTDTATAEPAPLTIAAGRFYKTRDGRKVGPMVDVGSGPDSDRWRGHFEEGHHSYWSDDGTHWQGQVLDTDLIAEWPADTGIAKPASNDNAATPKFKVGDRVVIKKNRDAWGVDADPNSIGSVVTLIRRDRDICNQIGWEAWDVDGSAELDWVRSDDIELYQSTPAIVAMLENGQPRPSVRPHVHATTEAAHLEAARLATQHKGQEFAVYALDGNVHKVGTIYEHEWQRLAAEGQIHNAIAALMKATGMHVSAAIHAVKLFSENKRAA